MLTSTEQVINVMISLLTKVPEYCSSLDEKDVVDNAFEVIFAFDEIVALGYRENVNLSQIRTYIEMESHEENVFQAVRKVGDFKNSCNPS